MKNLIKLMQLFLDVLNKMFYLFELDGMILPVIYEEYLVNSPDKK